MKFQNRSIVFKDLISHHKLQSTLPLSRSEFFKIKLLIKFFKINIFDARSHQKDLRTHFVKLTSNQASHDKVISTHILLLNIN